MAQMPNKPWKDVAMDFWGPINTEEYLLVTVCKQSRYAEVEFVTSTSSSSVEEAQQWTVPKRANRTSKVVTTKHP